MTRRVQRGLGKQQQQHSRIWILCTLCFFANSHRRLQRTSNTFEPPSSKYAPLLLLGSLLSGLGDLATLAIGLLDALDDTDSDGLSHVTDGESTKRRILVVRLNAHRLRRDELNDGGITRLDELGAGFHCLTRSSIDLLDELGELAGNVGGVAIKDGSVTSADLTGVVEDDDLGVEGGGFLGGVVLGVGADVTTSDILHRNVPE